MRRSSPFALSISSMFVLLTTLSAFLVLTAAPVEAQTCWVYTDSTPAPAPMKCVQKNNLANPCSCNPSNTTGSCLSDCTAIPAPAGSQTIRKVA